MTSPEMTLRPMRWWDVKALLPDERELFGPTAWTAEMFWSELAHPDTRFYVVAQDGGGIAGYAGIMVIGADSDVQTVAVALRAQGTGLGERLVAALLDAATERGATSTLLEVRADNTPAKTLYERFGFARIAVRKGYYADGDAHVMRLRPITSRRR